MAPRSHLSSSRPIPPRQPGNKAPSQFPTDDESEDDSRSETPSHGRNRTYKDIRNTRGLADIAISDFRADAPARIDTGAVYVIFGSKKYISDIDLAIGLSNADLQLWDADRGKQIRSLKGHAARVSSIAWNGSTLSSGGRDSVILNHDVRSVTILLLVFTILTNTHLTSELTQ